MWTRPLLLVAALVMSVSSFAAELDLHQLPADFLELKEEAEAGGAAIPPLPELPRGFLLDPPPRRSIEGHTLQTTLAASGIYAGAFAIMWSLPDDSTHWEKDGLWERFRDAPFNTPVWDDDHWSVNWVLHPWWGMWVYQSERNYGESTLRSFLIASAHSLAFEYLVEAWTEHPSAQDLLSTSPLGSIFGELVHRWIQRAGRDGFSRWERLLIDVLNPTYRWQIGFDRKTY